MNPFMDSEIDDTDNNGTTCTYNDALSKLKCYEELTGTDSTQCINDMAGYAEAIDSFAKCNKLQQDFCSYVGTDAVQMCDSWGTEFTDRFQFAGAGDSSVRSPNNGLPPGKYMPHEFGFKSQCEASFNGTGKYYIFYPLGWFKVWPLLGKTEFDISYERGVCFPPSCSKEHVLLLMSKIKPSQFNQVSFETVFGSDYNEDKISSKQITGFVETKDNTIDLPTGELPISSVLYINAVLEIMPKEIRRNDSVYWGFIGILIALVVPSILCALYIYLIEEFTEKRPKLPLLLAPFDLESNWNSLTNVKHHPKAITNIDGIRVLSMMIVVFGHIFSTTLQVGIGTWRNPVQMIQDVLGFDKMLVPADLSVDSFFVMGGVVTAYVAQKKVNSFFRFGCGKFGVGMYLDLRGMIGYLLFYANRWFRLTPLVRGRQRNKNFFYFRFLFFSRKDTQKRKEVILSFSRRKK